ncbi:hypothetical protein A2671_00170 [Candidatus Kaiserbacteria bacterium RIFCSPHIGHO2_01_FULL_49_13]|uniref:Uncharacterized protein n=1 Tax=Candidatus Kaiserbacteria bacterium RIFCSPHIGHO2_01_FULL_49_13 TaxID=1798477 RepID=A0A1F6CE63_9BACT|nr:MAG: hypothetical protein A2671_00170 [Candidatus Kaiserbacteria bacterium RIFCSPHIGHO2_01_FULL_49_13]
MVKDFIGGLRHGARAFGDLISDSVNLVLLIAVYFVGIGLVSVIARLAGKRFLDLGRGKRESYWNPVAKQPQQDDFYRMF